MEMNQGNCVQTYWKGYVLSYISKPPFTKLAKSKNAAVLSSRYWHLNLGLSNVLLGRGSSMVTSYVAGEIIVLFLFLIHNKV